MQLSVIIVSFNVKLLLEQCLHSLQSSLNEFEGLSEVIIVDNHSSDGSVEHVSVKFSQFNYILNEENAGFAKACNQGLAASSGKYVLFLNPDTMIPAGCLKLCVEKMDSDEKIGALGVRMVNADGKYLPESKRGRPTTAASFYKLFGFAMLFPRSKRFAKYYLGHLDDQRNHFVEVLSGAFMMIRRSVLDKTGGFDEAFFMYGEDIDLSYRITNAGFGNYYLGEVTIVHLKGRSTSKSSTGYIHHFYKAMHLFVDKHYTNSGSIQRSLLHLGIWIRKRFALTGHFIKNFFNPN